MGRGFVVAAVAASACGRIGFEPAGGSDAAVEPDAGTGLGTFGGPGADVGFALAPYPDGGIVVAGWLGSAAPIGGLPTTNAGGSDLAVFRLAPDGTTRWVRTFGSAVDDRALAVGVAPDGTIYLGGVVHGSLDLGGGVLAMLGDDDGFVASYTADGDYRWAHLIGGPVTGATYGSDEIRGMAAGGDGVYVTGYVAGDVDFGGTVVGPTGGSFDAFLAAYDPSGGLRWVRRWGDTRYNAGHVVSIAANGDVIVGGYYEGTPDLGGGPASAYRGTQDAFVVVRDRDGNFRWQTDFGGPGFDWVYGVGTDTAGNVYADGFFETTVDLDGGIASAGGRDGVVASWAADGGFRWARTTGGPTCDTFRQLAVIDDSVIAVGGFSGTVDLGAGPVTAGGPYDALVRAYATDGTPGFAASTGGTGSDYLLGVGGTTGLTAFIVGETDGSGGDWCASTSDTDSDGSINRLVLP